MQLIRPTLDLLPHYLAAIRGGWPPSLRDGAAEAELAALALDAGAVIRRLNDAGANGGDVRGFTRWLWDGAFCGRIAFRYLPGSAAPPPASSGHIGYGVVPAKQGNGYARSALQQLLEEIAPLGLPHVALTTDPANIASQRVIIANGGVRAGEETHPTGVPLLTWHIALRTSSNG